MNELRDEIYKNALAHGWYESERTFGEIIALCHAELSEALEEYRNGYMPNEIYYDCNCDRAENNGMPITPCKNCSTKPEGIPIELADCIIRILDYCGSQGIDIDDAIRIKHAYNKTRPYRHGGKVI